MGACRAAPSSATRDARETPPLRLSGLSPPWRESLELGDASGLRSSQVIVLHALPDLEVVAGFLEEEYVMRREMGASDAQNEKSSTTSGSPAWSKVAPVPWRRRCR